MPSSFTPSLRLTLPVTGENPGTWGDLVNNGITSLVDSSVAGYAAVTMTDANYTLTTANGAADESRKMMLNISGTLSGARNVICPTASKLYFVKNATTGGFAITLKTAAGSGVSIPNGRSMVLMCNGTDVIDATDYSSSLNTAALSYSTTLTGGTGVVALGTNQFYKDASGNIGVGTAAPGSKLDVVGTLRLSGSTSGYVGLAPAAIAGSTTYTLPAADGTTGQVLQTNGTATLSWTTPSAGVANFTSNLNTTAPNATVPYVQLLATNASYANIDVAITPKGTGAFSLQVADNGTAGGNKRGTNAVDLQTSRSAATQVASGPGSFVAGYSNTASSSGSVAMGNSNTTSAGSFNVAIGQSNTSQGNFSVALGQSNLASGSASIALGQSNTTTGTSAFVCGTQNTANPNYSATIGGTYGAARTLVGNRVFPAAFGTTSGARQFTVVTLGLDTTDTTTSYLTSNGVSSINSTTTNIVLADNSAFYFEGTIVAGVTGGGNTKSWKIEGVAKRGATAGSVAFVGTPTVTSSFADAGASTWTIAVAINTTIGGFNIVATGQATTNIRWVGTMQVVEMTY